jgi:hypothetical protein
MFARHFSLRQNAPNPLVPLAGSRESRSDALPGGRHGSFLADNQGAGHQPGISPPSATKSELPVTRRLKINSIPRSGRDSVSTAFASDPFNSIRRSQAVSRKRAGASRSLIGSQAVNRRSLFLDESIPVLFSREFFCKHLKYCVFGRRVLTRAGQNLKFPCSFPC